MLSGRDFDINRVDGREVFLYVLIFRQRFELVDSGSIFLPIPLNYRNRTGDNLAKHLEKEKWIKHSVPGFLAKTNTTQILKQHDIEDVKSL